ncbi:O-antigen ligase family protein [Caminibacter mediatlanticus TB-2]|uniref:O-antigen ligase family protein n=1 Tax=Caminibacter mediatlanticus TB-2 TaxID=391592 RepID=A0ABX5V8G0_9BACT|nr:O-antigen ligase family protein [Caminibacter mediatlanticus]QCT93899.1 O-antigen ligase family protein [Caminibacter mediatlanticus TB-2]
MKLLSSLRNNANIILNYLVILYAFSIPLDLKIYRFVVIALFIFFILQKDIKEKIKWTLKNRFFQLFLIYIIYQFLVVLWTPNKEYGLRFALKYVEYFLPLFIITSSLKKEFINKVINGWLLSMFITEIIAYGIYFDLWSTKYHNLHLNTITPFYHHTIYSLFLSTSILIMLYKLLYEKWSIFHYISLFFLLTMSINLFLTIGRGGQIAFFITLFVLLFIKFRKNKKILFISIFTPFLIFFLAYNYSNKFHNRINLAINDTKNIFENKNFCGSWGNRVGSYIVAKDIIEKSPLLGVGFHTPMEILPIIVHEKYPYLKCIIPSQTIHLHNTFLMEITQTGIIGLFLFLLILFYLVKIKVKNNFIRYLKTVFLIHFIFFSIIDYSWHISYLMKYFVLFSSIILASTYHETNNTEKDIS